MFVEFHDANAICTSFLVHSHLCFDAVFGVVSQDHNIAFSPCTLQGATETQTKAVWVRQLRQDCTRQHLPQFKVDCFLNMYRFQKLLKKMPFNIIPLQVLYESSRFPLHVKRNRTRSRSWLLIGCSS